MRAVVNFIHLRWFWYELAILYDSCLVIVSKNTRPQIYKYLWSGYNQLSGIETSRSCLPFIEISAASLYEELFLDKVKQVCNTTLRIVFRFLSHLIYYYIKNFVILNKDSYALHIIYYFTCSKEMVQHYASFPSAHNCHFHWSHGDDLPHMKSGLNYLHNHTRWSMIFSLTYINSKWLLEYLHRIVWSDL